MADLNAAVETARAAFARRDWVVARDGFSTARHLETLSADDFFALAESAWWLGAIDESLRAFADAYRLYLDAERPRRAAMAAMYLALHCMERGNAVIGSGWMGRADRLLCDEAECVEHGYRLYHEIFSALGRGNVAEAGAHAGRMHESGRPREPSDRPPPVTQRKDRGTPPVQHLRQARPAVPCRSRRLRLRAPSGSPPPDHGSGPLPKSAMTRRLSLP